MTNDAAQFIGNIPEHYDKALRPIIFVDYAEDIARRLAALRPSAVLETAAGTGIVTRRLRDLLPTGAALTATDLNQPMLDVACSKFSASDHVTFQTADAMALPFADACFDAVVCQFGVMFFPDKPKSYREVHRVLKPGGHYLFNVWDAPSYNPFARIAGEVVERFFPVDPPQFYTVPFSCAQIDPVKEGLLQAGFEKIEISVVAVSKDIPNAGAFARGLVFGNPLADQIRLRGGVDPEQVVEAILGELRRAFGADPARMTLQAMVYSAAKPR